VGCTSGTGTCSLTPATSLNPGAATFWVQAWNTLGYSAWSAPRAFTVSSITMAITELFQVSGGMPGAMVRLWARVQNNGGVVPSDRNLWFLMTTPSGGSSWVGARSLASMPASSHQWFFLDWTIGAGAASGGYQYQAQVWAGSTMVSALSAPRDFTVGFNHQFNSGGLAPWEATSGTWTVQSGFMTAPGRELDSQHVGYGTSVSSFKTLDFTARLWRDGDDFSANRLMVRGIPLPLGSASAWHSMYQFQYTRSGSFSVFKRVAGAASAIQNWTATTAINQGEAYNILRVVAHGTTFWFYINGTLVWTGTDTSHSAGQVGLGFYSEPAAGNRLWVDFATMGDPALPFTPLTEQPFTAPVDQVSADQQRLNEEANRLGAGGDPNRAPEREN
jgi:hypothetical protein